MTATCTITSVTDPVTSANQSAVVAAGTCTASNTVTVTIEDALAATVGPVAATVVGTAWSIAATNISALADGALVYKATSTDGSASAFDAAAATKSAGPNYITDTIFRESITDSSSLNPNKVTRAIQWASRRVDEICGRNFAIAGSTATAKVFVAESARRCRVDDFATTTDLVVKVDDGDDGTYDTTWTINTDFVVTPQNAVAGGLAWPYTGIRAVNSLGFPKPGKWPSPVQVTARWGWTAVPDAVVAATTLLAVRYYSRPDAPFGWQGGLDGAIPVRRDWDVEELLADYVKTDAQFLVA